MEQRCDVGSASGGHRGQGGDQPKHQARYSRSGFKEWKAENAIAAWEDKPISLSVRVLLFRIDSPRIIYSVLPIPRYISFSLWDQDAACACCWPDRSCDIIACDCGFVPGLAKWVSVAQRKISETT